MVEKVGADNIFVHLDTYHMNIEEKGMGNGILACSRPPQIYPSLGKSDRGTPGDRQLQLGRNLRDAGRDRLQRWARDGELHQHGSALAYGLSVWRPVAKSEAVVMGNGLPFLRNKARQYGLIN